MFTPDQIKKEVKSIFGKDASRVEVGYKPDIDGVFIKVYKKVGDQDILSLTHCLTSIEILQAFHPLSLLKARIIQMHSAFKENIKRHTQPDLPGQK